MVVATIRTLIPEDAQAYRDLRLEALETEPTAFGSSAEEHRALTLAQIEARLGEAPGGTLNFGAFIDGVLVGTGGLARATRPKEVHRADVVGMYVTSAFRGRGIARQLLRTIIERARTESGLERLNLAVATHAQAAQSVYRSLGFVSYGVAPDAIRVWGESIDMNMMTLELKPPV